MSSWPRVLGWGLGQRASTFRTHDEIASRETASGILVLPSEQGTDREQIKQLARQYKLEPMDIADLWLMLAAFVLCRSNRTEHISRLPVTST